MQESRKRAGQNGFLENPHPPKTRKIESLLKKLVAVNRKFKEHINAADAGGCFDEACVQYTEYMERLRREYPESWGTAQQAVDNGGKRGAIAEAATRTQGGPLLRMVAHQDAMDLDTKRAEGSRRPASFTPTNPRAFASTGVQDVQASFSFPAEHQDAKPHFRKSTPFPASKTFKSGGKLSRVVENASNPIFGKPDGGGARDVGKSHANTGGLFGTQPTFGFGAAQSHSGGVGAAQFQGVDKNIVENEDASGDPSTYDGGEDYDAEEEERPVFEGGDGEYDEEHGAIEQEEYETEDNGGNVSDLDDAEGQVAPTLQEEQEDGGEEQEPAAGVFDKQGQGVKLQGIVQSGQGIKPDSSDPKPVVGFGGGFGGFGSPGVNFKSTGGGKDSAPTPIAFGSPHSVKSSVPDSVGSTPLQFGVENPLKNPGSHPTFGNPAPTIFGVTSPVPIAGEPSEKKKIGESILKTGMSTGGFGEKGKAENKKVTFGNGVAIFRADKPEEGNANGHSKLGGGILGGTEAPSSSAPVFGWGVSGVKQGEKSNAPSIFGGGVGGGGETKSSSSGFGGIGGGLGSQSKPLFGSSQSTESTEKTAFGQLSGTIFGNSTAAAGGGGGGGFSVPSANAFAAPSKIPAPSSQPPTLFGTGQGTGQAAASFGVPSGGPVFGNANPSSGMGTFWAPSASTFGGGDGGGGGGLFTAPTAGAGQDSEDKVPKDKPSVEVKDNETWEVKTKAKSKLYRQVENAWEQVGVGCVSVRVKRAGDRAGKGYLMFTTDSGNVLMCTALYGGMRVLEKNPKMLMTVATFLDVKINAEDPVHPKTEEKWVQSQALIQVAKPETAQELKNAIESLKDN
ncbi:hypothetical protein BSKO_01561 [Bryopsis sp. KO-2023]|nr:hypothetical protein BSKO_01561 [Bryopsis sp. KO-2023]